VETEAGKVADRCGLVEHIKVAKSKLL